MLLPLSWLKEFVELDNITPQELESKLFESGFEVEEIIYTGENIKNVVVGKILDIKKHFSADKLQICTVDEAGETLSCVPKQVNEEGKAVFNIDELPRNEGDKYKLSVTVKPEGYTATEIIFDNEKEITITLIAE